MIHYKKAQELIISNAKSFGTETISIEDVYGRILAEPVLADRDYPPFNRSKMDGYAIRFTDWTAGTRIFTVLETIYAGQQTELELKPNTCYKIMTGASVPQSADAVIRKEDSTQTEQSVTFLDVEVKPFQNIARKGEDIIRNEVIISSPVICNASVISSLASVGKQFVTVYKLPKVVLFTTGNEVKPVDYQINEVEIRNSNAYLLKSLLKNWGITPQHQHIEDDRTKLFDSIKPALFADIIILCGGVSAGDADYVPDILADLGVVTIFQNAAIRPGKPILCGLMPNGGMVFALPGNPFSCLVTFTLFVENYLFACNQLGLRPIYNIPLNGEKTKNHPLTEFFPCKLDVPQLSVSAISFNSSGDVRAGLLADGLGILPDTESIISQGRMIDFIPFTK